MDKMLKASIFSALLISLLASAYAQSCDHTFSNNNIYSTCITLPVLNSFLHWTYHSANHTVDIAYRRTGIPNTDWVCWALNLNSGGMEGSQCLVAFVNTSGAQAHTSPVNDYNPSLQPAPLSFGVPRIGAEYSSNQMIIYATLQLPSGRTSFNQVWQNGPVSGGSFAPHPMNGPNMRSTGRVDFVTGQTAGGGAAGGSREKKRNVHGVLNAVSWGILMPIGAVMARYLRVFKSADPAWFYLHVVCQSSAYIVGVAGWGTGLKLGKDSPGVTQTTHRNIGIILFCLGTLQVFALLLRPKPDHKFRFYWNIYHHVVGYSVIVLSIVNIFEGFDVLGGQENWKRAYIGFLIFLGAVALLLEIITWIIVLRRKKEGSDKYPHIGNGTNGYNSRQQHGV